MKEPVDIVVTVNSPGEVAGWLKPFLAALEAFPWQKRVTVFVPPCPFASGAEQMVVQEMAQVDRVVGPRQTVRFLLTGKLPSGFQPAGQGVVLFLGGDQTYAALLAKRLRYPALAYSEGLFNWEKTFARYAVPYEWMAEQIRKTTVRNKTVVIGNLMLDAVKPRYPREELKRVIGNEASPGVLLMPGSRPVHFQYMLAFFLKIAEKLKENRPAYACAVSISPFISEEQIRAALTGWTAAEWGVEAVYHVRKTDEGSPAGLEPAGELELANGLRIPCFRHLQYDLMQWADLALTIPGTNTVELSFMGVPMVVTIPLNYPEEIPLEGPAQLLSRVPVLGRQLKKRLLPKFLAKIKFSAWPNRLAGEMLVPELIGRLSVEEVADVALALLADEQKHRKTAARLRELAGAPGAAQRLVALLIEVLAQTYGE